jgi:hypothetical protein
VFSESICFHPLAFNVSKCVSSLVSPPGANGWVVAFRQVKLALSSLSRRVCGTPQHLSRCTFFCLAFLLSLRTSPDPPSSSGTGLAKSCCGSTGGAPAANSFRFFLVFGWPSRRRSGCSQVLFKPPAVSAIPMWLPIRDVGLVCCSRLWQLVPPVVVFPFLRDGF